MNLLILSTLTILCIAAVSARYPYDDSYAQGDIVPHGIGSGYGYGGSRHRGRYPIKIREGGIYGSRYGGYGGRHYDRKHSRYGTNRDVLHRDYPRGRYGDHDSYLPPRGLGGHRRGYDRPDYEYGREKVHRPPLYHDDDGVNYGGYNKITGIGIGYN